MPQGTVPKVDIDKGLQFLWYPPKKKTEENKNKAIKLSGRAE